MWHRDQPHRRLAALQARAERILLRAHAYESVPLLKWVLLSAP
jgi:hypothetical protein